MVTSNREVPGNNCFSYRIRFGKGDLFEADAEESPIDEKARRETKTTGIRAVEAGRWWRTTTVPTDPLEPTLRSFGPSDEPQTAFALG